MSNKKSKFISYFLEDPLAMKMKDMQIGKGRGDALLSLTVLEEKLIVCKASRSPITAFSKNFDIDRS